MWLVFFAEALTLLAVMPSALPFRLPVTDTILSWSRSLKDREPAPPKFFVLTLTPAPTDTMLVCTSASAFTVSAVSFLLLVISELNLLVTLPTVTAAPTVWPLLAETPTATSTMALPAVAPSLLLVSLLK